MAWNKPSNGEAASSPLRGKGGASVLKRRGRRFPVRITGAVVVLGAGIAAWWFWTTGESVGVMPPPQTKQRIKEVKPAVARTNTTEIIVSKSLNGIDPNARPTHVGEKVNGYIMMPSGEIHKMTGKSHSLNETPDPSQIFDNGAENEIAALLTVEPGEGIVGGPDRETFTAEFLKSTTVPIIVKSDDPEEVKALKRAVNQVKIELKAAYDRGEDIVGIIEKSYEDCRRLEQYKTDLFGEVLDYSGKEEVTDEDVKDYLSAANKLLEQKGIAPLDDTPFIRTKIEYDYNIERNDK